MDTNKTTLTTTTALPGYAQMRKLAIEHDIPLQSLSAFRDDSGCWIIRRDTTIKGSFKDIPMMPYGRKD